MRTVAWIAVGLVLSCSAEEATEVLQLVPRPVADQAGTLEGGLICDDGETAFVERVIIAMWGRRSLSARETALLEALSLELGRKGLVVAMAASPDYRRRWALFLADSLQVVRNSERANADCSAEGILGRTDPDLARFVRETAPTGEPWLEPWNLTDLLDSALALDDLSPVFRVGLFTMLGSVVHEPHNDHNELGYRRLYADIFSRTYVGRRAQCLTCHNSEASITGHLDPALDRTWEIPGHFEKALFGSSGGVDVAGLQSMFRIHGVHALDFVPEGPTDFWARGSGHQPWGMRRECGMFVLPGDVVSDPLEGSGFLVEAHEDLGTIWDIEQLLADGFSTLRAKGLDIEDDFSVAGSTALAWLTSTRLTDAVFEELTGSPLSLSHGFARNRYQRDLLRGLTEAYVADGFSLISMLAMALTHPYANVSAPDRCAGTAYTMPPIFDPWAPAAFIEEQRNNSPGDLVTRLPARVLMTAAADALEWPRPRAHLWYEEDGLGFNDEAQLQRQLGVPITDSERGFRGATFQSELAWEDAIATCRSPFSASDAPDFIDRLAAAAPGHTLRDLIAVLRDRVLADGSLDDETEARLLAHLAGDALERPASELNDLQSALRRICTGLLRSPWFTMQGVHRAQPRVAPALTLEGTDSGAFCTALAQQMDMQCLDGRLQL